jgi:hypothetical protein
MPHEIHAMNIAAEGHTCGRLDALHPQRTLGALKLTGRLVRNLRVGVQKVGVVAL